MLVPCRAGTTTEWAARDPHLNQGEYGVDTTTSTIKKGPGRWSSLSTMSAADTLNPVILPTTTDGLSLVSDSTVPEGYSHKSRIAALPALLPAVGEYVVAAGGSTSNTTPTLGRVYLSAIDLKEATVWGGIAYNLTIQGVGGTSPKAMVGLYADDGSGSRPALAAPISGTTQTYDPTVTTGEKYTAWGSTKTIQPGRYWYGFAVTSGTAFGTAPQVLAFFTSTVGMPRTALATGVSAWTFDTSSSASALPTLTSVTASGSAMPVMGIKRAA